MTREERSNKQECPHCHQGVLRREASRTCPRCLAGYKDDLPARLAAVERERDDALAAIAEWGDYAESLSEMRARIAAVEALCAKREAYLDAEAAHDRFTSLPVVWINDVRAVLAASPTPTGPEPLRVYRERSRGAAATPEPTEETP